MTKSLFRATLVTWYLVVIAASSSPKGQESTVRCGIDHEGIFSTLREEDARKRVLGFRNYKEMHEKYHGLQYKTRYLEKRGVAFEDGHICCIKWRGKNLKTSDIDWEWLSIKTLYSLDLSANKLSGVLDDIPFPQTLHHLILSDDQLTGKSSRVSCIDFTKLPLSLQTLYLNRNKFHGPLRFKDLPQSIKNVNMGGNKLYGDIDRSALPQTLEKLCLVGCWFSGRETATSFTDCLMDLDPYRFNI